MLGTKNRKFSGQKTLLAIKPQSNHTLDCGQSVPRVISGQKEVKKTVQVALPPSRPVSSLQHSRSAVIGLIVLRSGA